MYARAEERVDVARRATRETAREREAADDDDEDRDDEANDRDGAARARGRRRRRRGDAVGVEIDRCVGVRARTGGIDGAEEDDGGGGGGERRGRAEDARRGARGERTRDAGGSDGRVVETVLESTVGGVQRADGIPASGVFFSLCSLLRVRGRLGAPEKRRVERRRCVHAIGAIRQRGGVRIAVDARVHGELGGFRIGTRRARQRGVSDDRRRGGGVARDETLLDGVRTERRRRWDRKFSDGTVDVTRHLERRSLRRVRRIVAVLGVERRKRMELSRLHRTFVVLRRLRGRVSIPGRRPDRGRITRRELHRTPLGLPRRMRDGIHRSVSALYVWEKILDAARRRT